jgi:translation initiation factor IF-2
MTDSNDKDRKTEGNRPAGGTLTLKRPSIEQSKVRQSFGAGRSKTVVVETKRKRFGDDKPAEPKPAFQPQPRVMATPAAGSPAPQTPKPQQPAAPRSGVVLRTLTAEEKEARDRALAGARVREAEDRKRQEDDARRRAELDDRERKDREAAARRKAEEEARHRAEEEARRKAEEAAKKLMPRAAQPNVVTPATAPVKPRPSLPAAPLTKRMKRHAGLAPVRSSARSRRRFPCAPRARPTSAGIAFRWSTHWTRMTSAAAPSRRSAAAPSDSRSSLRASRCPPRR